MRIINSCIEDAKEYNKEIWLTFQDLSKAYDWIDLNMLKLAMKRIKIPELIIKLILNLFTDSKKAIIGNNRIFEKFTSIIGIDQEEVISPLLFTIYYDPLLTEINDLKYGYNMKHEWKNNVLKDEKESLQITIRSQAYMDDVTWLTHDKKTLENILSIADEFNKINNIKVNYDKFVLATNTKNRESDGSITLKVGIKQHKITPVKTDESVRILGV